MQDSVAFAIGPFGRSSKSLSNQFHGLANLIDPHPHPPGTVAVTVERNLANLSRPYAANGRSRRTSRLILDARPTTPITPWSRAVLFHKYAGRFQTVGQRGVIEDEIRDNSVKSSSIALRFCSTRVQLIPGKIDRQPHRPDSPRGENGLPVRESLSCMICSFIRPQWARASGIRPHRCRSLRHRRCDCAGAPVLKRGSGGIRPFPGAFNSRGETPPPGSNKDCVQMRCRPKPSRPALPLP